MKHFVNVICPESQCGFHFGGGIMDRIFSLFQLNLKVSGNNQELFMIFVDPAKAVDILKRKARWKVLKKLSIPTNVEYYHLLS